MAKDELDEIEAMLQEAHKIAKTGTPQQLINALTVIEKYARKHNLTKFANEARTKIAKIRKNL